MNNYNLQLVRTNARHPDFHHLVRQLDEFLADYNGDLHPFFDQHNKLEHIKHVVLAYDNKVQVVGCGAIKQYADDVFEIKRMYVLPHQRGQGIGAAVLGELEAWAAELDAMACILETGLEMPDAIALYKKRGYHKIPNFAPYEGVDASICMEKKLWTTNVAPGHE